MFIDWKKNVSFWYKFGSGGLHSNTHLAESEG